jgi:hypothetical protein
VGKSEEYVRSLVRIYKLLPPNIKAEWAADRDHRFTYNRLTDLVRLSEKGDQVGMYRLLRKILADPARKRRDAPKLPFKTGQEHLIDLITGRGLDDEKKRKRHARRMSRGQMEKMEARLGSIPMERLTQSSVSADVFRRFLSALLGKVDRSEAWSIVDDLAREIEKGEQEVDQPSADPSPSTTNVSPAPPESLPTLPPESLPTLVNDTQQPELTSLPLEELDALDDEDAEELMLEWPTPSGREPRTEPSSVDEGAAAPSTIGDSSVAADSRSRCDSHGSVDSPVCRYRAPLGNPTPTGERAEVLFRRCVGFPPRPRAARSSSARPRHTGRFARRR